MNGLGVLLVDLMALAVVAGLIAGIVIAARSLARSGPARTAGTIAPMAGQEVPSDRQRPVWAPRTQAGHLLLIGVMLLAAAGVTAVIVAGSAGAFDPTVSSPSARMVTGIWKGPRGATLVLHADGTFTASHLPSPIGDWSAGSNPSSGRGTWHVGRFDSSTPQGVIFTFSSCATPGVSAFSNCSKAELEIEHDGSSLAMFYDLGDPDEGWSGQYRFVKQ